MPADLTPRAAGDRGRSLQEQLRELEDWNHEQFVDARADGGSFYEAEQYERGAECYDRAEKHRMASVAIEASLASSSSDRGQEWQPIETAPKDGTFVLVYAPNVGEPRVTVGSWDREPDEEGGQRWRDDLFAWDTIEPTHWKTLPEPPAERGQARTTPDEGK